MRDAPSINPTPTSAIVHIVFFRYMIRSTAILVVLQFFRPNI